MKVLLLLAAVASTAYVGYSYSSTDGKSCLVCPMTGEPVFSSAAPESAPCCAGKSSAMLTSLSDEAPTCCSSAASSSIPKTITQVTFTAENGTACEGSCEKSCCQEKKNTIDVTEKQEEATAEGVVAEAE